MDKAKIIKGKVSSVNKTEKRPGVLEQFSSLVKLPGALTRAAQAKQRAVISKNWGTIGKKKESLYSEEKKRDALKDAVKSASQKPKIKFPILDVPSKKEKQASRQDSKSI